jgi:hypothetical protein
VVVAAAFASVTAWFRRKMGGKKTVSAKTPPPSGPDLVS